MFLARECIGVLIGTKNFWEDTAFRPQKYDYDKKADLKQITI